MNLASSTNLIENIESIINIAFALTAGVLAVLTYVRARETFLQPVRSEVIKKQTNLLIDLFSLMGDEFNLIEKIDYHGIVEINIFDSLKICGAVFNNDEAVKEMIGKRAKGGIMFMEDDGRVRSIEKPTLFSDQSTKTSPQQMREDYEMALSGKYKISLLRLTNDHMEFMSHLSKISENPFLPKKIKEHLEVLIKEIRQNLTENLKDTIEQVINKNFTEHKNKTPNVSAVYNLFNERRLSHSVVLKKINDEIRKYLKIDSMPF